jgi:hypothetical protein
MKVGVSLQTHANLSQEQEAPAAVEKENLWIGDMV